MAEWTIRHTKSEFVASDKSVADIFCSQKKDLLPTDQTGHRAEQYDHDGEFIENRNSDLNMNMVVVGGLHTKLYGYALIEGIGCCVCH